jgi:3-oxoacyl-[acyl-carrier-protein] synthase-1
LEGLDAELLTEIQRELDITFSNQSELVPLGRVGVAYALMKASNLIDTQEISTVLIVAVDSLLSFTTLVAHESDGRLLNGENSNGFLPGEGAGALLLGSLDSGARLQFMGAGFGVEEAVIASEKPLLGVGLSIAIREALANAECQIHDLDFRITDLSGEQYYFKEASLALTRILRVRKEEFDMWHPAQCVGETGAVSGAIIVAVADAACRKGYAPGQKILCHASNDSGERAATIFNYQEC